jgi:hypothetical protein
MRISIHKFQELYKISQYNVNEIERASLLVQCLTGKSEHEINKMNINKFNKLCNNINAEFEILSKKMDAEKPKQIVKANGRFYWLNYDMAKKPNNAGKYVELATFSEDIVGNLHKIMATMATPLKFSFKGMVKTERDHADIANDMLHLDFKVAYHASVFFWAVFSESIMSLKGYLEAQTEKKKELTDILNHFQSLSDGFTTAKWYQNLKVSA